MLSLVPRVPSSGGSGRATSGWGEWPPPSSSLRLRSGSEWGWGQGRLGAQGPLPRVRASVPGTHTATLCPGGCHAPQQRRRQAHSSPRFGGPSQFHPSRFLTPVEEPARTAASHAREPDADRQRPRSCHSHPGLLPRARVGEPASSSSCPVPQTLRKQGPQANEAEWCETVPLSR